MEWWVYVLIMLGCLLVGSVIGCVAGTETARSMIPELRTMPFLKAAFLLLRLALKR